MWLDSFRIVCISADLYCLTGIGRFQTLKGYFISFKKVSGGGVGGGKNDFNVNLLRSLTIYLIFFFKVLWYRTHFQRRSLEVLSIQNLCIEQEGVASIPGGSFNWKIENLFLVGGKWSKSKSDRQISLHWHAKAVGCGQVQRRIRIKIHQENSSRGWEA